MSLDLEAADLLERAADALESGRLGWMQGRLVDHLGRVCAVGALRTVAGSVDRVTLATLRAVELVERRVPEVPGLQADLDRIQLVRTRNLVWWNDRVATDVNEVIELFKYTAKEVRNAQ